MEQLFSDGRVYVGMKALVFLFSSLLAIPVVAGLPYVVVDTMQQQCYGDRGAISAPSKGQAFYGQDAQHQGPQAHYVVSKDRLTVADTQTGLVWQKSPETNEDGKLTHDDKLTWEQALLQPGKLNQKKFGGYSDWRLPTIKELYSLFDARGTDPAINQENDANSLKPFIDASVFDFIYGDVANGARIIDSQYGSATKYVGKSPRGGDKVFGVNFADGRIKGYDQGMPGGHRQFKFFILCVRGNPDYGKNHLVLEKDLVVDRATGLTWTKADSGKGLTWQEALAYVDTANQKKYLGYSDWRLPNIKELQSIVDYSKSPDTSNSPAIDSKFQCSTITNEAGQSDYPYYWSGTTHVGMRGGAAAMYVAFGRAGGFLSEKTLNGGPPQLRGQNQTDPVKYVDVHGAGAQRSDPKSGDAKEFPRGRGPQGDVIRIQNYVRLVRTSSR